MLITSPCGSIAQPVLNFVPMYIWRTKSSWAANHAWGDVRQIKLFVRWVLRTCQNISTYQHYSTRNQTESDSSIMAPPEYYIYISFTFQARWRNPKDRHKPADNTKQLHQSPKLLEALQGLTTVNSSSLCMWCKYVQVVLQFEEPASAAKSLSPPIPKGFT
jgi:hypothetical protein